jgi:pentose-5-phosphate-3-epimerase
MLQPILSQLDAVLLLARVTGESTRGVGTTFNPLAIPRVRAVREMMTTASASADLQVAGGVNRHNAAELVAAGATTLALGAGIYQVPDMAREVAEVRGLVERARPLT